jgi:hypothetical protein
MCFLLPHLILAQNPDLLNLEPNRCYLGGTIKIFGWVKPGASGSAQMNLEFFPPRSGATIKHSVATRPNGEYEFLFTGTNQEGAWRVEAWKAGTSEKAQAKFEVSSSVFLKPLGTELKQIGKAQIDAFSYFKELILSYPDFSTKEEIITALDEILNTLQETDSLLNQLDAAADQLDAALQKAGSDLPEEIKKALRQAADKANEISADTKNRTTEINEVLESSKQEADWCYLWMSYYELCDRLNKYNNYLVTSLKDLATNLSYAKASQELDFSIAQFLGTCIHLIGLDVSGPPSLIGFANFMLGTITDLGKNVYQGLMTTCSYYRGDAEGEYYTELLHDEMSFFTMTYHLKGKIDLAFQKRKPGDPAVYIKGKFHGQIVDPECTITMAPFAPPDIIGPVWCLSATPLVSGRSYLLYLEGKAMDEKIELELSGSARDFDLKARAFYVLLSSTAYNLPIPGTFEFPLQNAEWFFTRTTQLSNPANEYVELPIEIKDGKAVIEKEFDRIIELPETSKRVGVNVKMKLQIKLGSD